MLQIYYSCSFRRRKDDEFSQEQKLVRQFLKSKLNEPVWFAERIQETDIQSLSQNILTLDAADLVVFAHDWENYKICRIEMKLCKEFGYKYIILPSL